MQERKERSESKKNKITPFFLIFFLLLIFFSNTKLYKHILNIFDFF
jgi:uncharacterized membrane protein YadS